MLIYGIVNMFREKYQKIAEKGEYLKTMNGLLKKLKDLSPIILPIALFVAAGCELVTGIAGVGGNFFDVTTSILCTLIIVTILVAIPVLKLMGKDDLLKPVTLIAIGYLFISMTQTYLTRSFLIDDYYEGYQIVVGIFTFLAGVALVAAFVIYLIAIFTKSDALKKIVGFILAILLAYIATLFVLWFIYAIVYGYGWTGYFDIVSTYLAIPCAMIFAVLPALIKD